MEKLLSLGLGKGGGGNLVFILCYLLYDILIFFSLKVNLIFLIRTLFLTRNYIFMVEFGMSIVPISMS